MIKPNTPSRILMQGVHIHLTESMQAAIQSKFGALLDHHAPIVRINVRLQKSQVVAQGSLYSATGQVEIAGPDLVAHTEGLDAYAVLEGLAEKLHHLLDRRHGMRKDKRNHPHGIEIPSELPKQPLDA